MQPALVQCDFVADLQIAAPHQNHWLRVLMLYLFSFNIIKMEADYFE
jgi:hypothetical protein